MKSLFDDISVSCSRATTQAYSTSFSWGIKLFNKELRNPVYSVYGLVRFADEIVDTFEGYDQRRLLAKFKADTFEAIEDRISLNPILNAFQQVYHQYKIDRSSVDLFFESMEMDLDRTIHDQASYETYILGSAEVVGLMCLRIFCDNDEDQYHRLRPYAMKLGSAFQKVNFLRDAWADQELLGRTYFPEVNLNNLTASDKKRIEDEIEQDFEIAMQGIAQLPSSSRRGVQLAYIYYMQLLKKIRKASPDKIMNERIRVSNGKKMTLIISMFLRGRDSFSY